MASLTGDALIAFWSARLDEDEASAKLAAREGGTWTQDDPERYPGSISSLGGPVVYDEGAPDEYQGAHIARHDPARVLREVEAGRKLLDLYERAKSYRDQVFAQPESRSISDEMRAVTQMMALEQVLKLRASVYSDHPDYRLEWAPGV